MLEIEPLEQKNNLAKSLYKAIKKDGNVEKNLLEKFIRLDREEGRKVLSEIIELEEHIEKKQKLIDIYEHDHMRYDGRILISAIWSTLNPSFNN